MAEVSQQWLEAQLVRQLAQVKAPDSLWIRVQAERRAVRNVSGSIRSRTSWMLWPAVAMGLLIASASLYWQSGRATGTDSRIASNNPAEIRAWMKAKADMDVDLVCGGAAKIQLSGARLVHVRDEVVAEIAYELEGVPGLLRVSNKSAASNPEARLVFMSPLPKDPDASCRSCHV